jgi:signal transduction histidine kinase
VGIREADLPRLFQAFERLVTSSEGSGTGLGLALTKQLVELHGGAIDVASSLGEGSTFVVRMPRDEQRDEARSRA